MSSLLSKLFVWVWGTVLVTALAAAVTTAQLGGAKIPPMIERAHQQFAEAGAEAVAVFESGGVEALRQWRATQRGAARGLYLFDPSGKEVFGRPVRGVLGRNDRVAPEALAAGVTRERRGRIVHLAPVAGEGVYRLVMRFEPPHPVWHLFTVPGLVVAVVLSGLICAGLAWYLASPVQRLRGVIQSLARGELGRRPDAALTRRSDEIGSLARDVDRMAERLQSLIEREKRLLRDVSHELRSPLARLQAALGLARQRPELVPPELDRIETEVERLETLVGHSLSLMRLASDDAPPRDEPVDLVTLLQDVAADARYEGAASGRAVRVEAEGATIVRGDPELLHRALENIVRNGLRHAPAGSEVFLRLDRQPGHARISVSDQGPGVAEADLVRLFDPFFRANPARDRASGGHGLGLAIASRSIAQHGGQIWAANGPAGGLEVTLSLPLPSSSEAEA